MEKRAFTLWMLKGWNPSKNLKDFFIVTETLGKVGQHPQTILDGWYLQSNAAPTLQVFLALMRLQHTQPMLKVPWLPLNNTFLCSTSAGQQPSPALFPGFAREKRYRSGKGCSPLPLPMRSSSLSSVEKLDSGPSVGLHMKTDDENRVVFTCNCCSLTSSVQICFLSFLPHSQHPFLISLHSIFASILYSHTCSIYLLFMLFHCRVFLSVGFILESNSFPTKLVEICESDSSVRQVYLLNEGKQVLTLSVFCPFWRIQ